MFFACLSKAPENWFISLARFALGSISLSSSLTRENEREHQIMDLSHVWVSQSIIIVMMDIFGEGTWHCCQSWGFVLSMYPWKTWYNMSSSFALPMFELHWKQWEEELVYLTCWERCWTLAIAETKARYICCLTISPSPPSLLSDPYLIHDVFPTAWLLWM